MKLKELMTRDVRTCQTDTPLTEVARMMSEINCGAIPVCESQRPVGIITDRDIVLRAVAKGLETRNAKVGDCMTRDCITAPPDMDAHEAADMMASRQIRRLPVVEEGRICGIVALGDMATVNIHVDEAGNALSSISRPAEPGAHGSV